MSEQGRARENMPWVADRVESVRNFIWCGVERESAVWEGSLYTQPFGPLLMESTACSRISLTWHYSHRALSPSCLNMQLCCAEKPITVAADGYFGQCDCLWKPSAVNGSFWSGSLAVMRTDCYLCICVFVQLVPFICALAGGHLAITVPLCFCYTIVKSIIASHWEWAWYRSWRCVQQCYISLQM